MEAFEAADAFLDNALTGFVLRNDVGKPLALRGRVFGMRVVVVETRSIAKHEIALDLDETQFALRILGVAKNVPLAALERVETPKGLRLAVTKVEKETVTVDANHPLAGQTLHFEVEIAEVREATGEELQHGHVHGPGGHHHGHDHGHDHDHEHGHDHDADGSPDQGQEALDAGSGAALALGQQRPLAHRIAAALGVKVYPTALEPFKFPEAVLVNGGGKGYGEVG